MLSPRNPRGLFAFVATAALIILPGTNLKTVAIDTLRVHISLGSSKCLDLNPSADKKRHEQTNNRNQGCAKLGRGIGGALSTEFHSGRAE